MLCYDYVSQKMMFDILYAQSPYLHLIPIPTAYTYMYMYGFRMPSMKTENINPGPAEPLYALPQQTVKIQISWLLKKPTDLDLHCLSLCEFV